MGKKNTNSTELRVDSNQSLVEEQLSVVFIQASEGCRDGYIALRGFSTGNQRKGLLISGISFHGALNLPHKPTLHPQPPCNT